MSRQILGVHVFQKTEFIEWEDELAITSFLSAVSWKYFHGSISLYTNEAWLAVLKKWGFDKVYDHIDTQTLKEIPSEIDQKAYWAYGKLHVASTIKDDFVLVDNDLWIVKPLEFDDNLSYMGYHFENFDSTEETTPYIDFTNLIPTKWAGRWDKTLMATNAALLWFNDKNLLNEWLSIAKEIATNPEPIEIEDPQNIRRMVFLEQRLLPMIANEMGLQYGTFMKSIIYQTHKHRIDSNTQWEPIPENWTEEHASEYMAIRHIWGGKKLWTDYPEVREAQFGVVKNDLNEILTINLDRNFLPFNVNMQIYE